MDGLMFGCWTGKGSWGRRRSGFIFLIRLARSSISDVAPELLQLELLACSRALNRHLIFQATAFLRSKAATTLQV